MKSASDTHTYIYIDRERKKENFLTKKINSIRANVQQSRFIMQTFLVNSIL